MWTCEIVTIYLVNSPKKRSPRFQWSFSSVFLNHQLFIAREKMKGIDYEQYGSSCRMTSKFSQRIRSQPLISIIKSHNVNNNVSTFALFNRKYFYISIKIIMELTYRYMDSCFGFIPIWIAAAAGYIVRIWKISRTYTKIFISFSLIIFDYNTIKCQSFISQTNQSKWFTYETSSIDCPNQLKRTHSRTASNIATYSHVIKSIEFWKIS